MLLLLLFLLLFLLLLLLTLADDKDPSVVHGLGRGRDLLLLLLLGGEVGPAGLNLGLWHGDGQLLVLGLVDQLELR